MIQRFPDFLIIGAAKAGTTTLFRDMQSHPRVFFPLHKEPHSLVHEEILSESGRTEYAKLFAAAKPDQLIAEASTGYTKWPRYQGVAQRARTLLGADIKLIYLVREPVSRTISHHRHLYHDGRIATDINQVLKSPELDCRELIEISRYAAQIQPWIEAFGADHVRIVVFEEYIKDRQQTVASLQSFLGLDPRPELVDSESAHNVTADRRYGRGVIGRQIRRVTGSNVWKHKLRGMVPDRLVSTGKRLFFKPPLPEPPPLSPDTLDILLRVLVPDADRLATLMGRSASPWNFELVRERMRRTSKRDGHA